jgi:hypothetical protein
MAGSALKKRLPFFPSSVWIQSNVLSILELLETLVRSHGGDAIFNGFEANGQQEPGER